MAFPDLRITKSPIRDGAARTRMMRSFLAIAAAMRIRIETVLRPFFSTLHVAAGQAVERMGGKACPRHHLFHFVVRKTVREVVAVGVLHARIRIQSGAWSIHVVPGPTP